MVILKSGRRKKLRDLRVFCCFAKCSSASQPEVQGEYCAGSLWWRDFQRRLHQPKAIKSPTNKIKRQWVKTEMGTLCWDCYSVTHPYRSDFELVFPHLPGEGCKIFLIKLPLRPPPPPAPHPPSDLNSKLQIATASSRSQWALTDPNCKLRPYTKPANLYPIPSLRTTCQKICHATCERIYIPGSMPEHIPGRTPH